MNIYVGNLSYRTTEDELRQCFSSHGEVSSVRVITDKFSGRSKGFAFVEMPDDGQAQDAIEKLNGSEFGGRNIEVNQARPQRTDGGGGERRGGGGGGGHRHGGGGGGGSRHGGGDRDRDRGGFRGSNNRY